MEIDLEGMQQALDDIVEWMRDHGATSFVAKLRPPVSEAALDAAEQRIGAPLGAALRALYRWHDGQAWADQKEPFFETLFFLDLKEALRQRPELLDGYVRVPAGSTFADYHAAHDAIGEAALRSDDWFPFAEASFHFFAVHLGTQRVIRIRKGDVPWLHVVAPDLPTFLGDYASRLWDGELVLAGDTSLPDVEQEGLAFLGRHVAPRD
ncbi:MAG: SMI1/KNR4 family protein [Deltaproteobacteria bacterium]|nr:SMI1/KNR4 family protein [Deltaproteobacteria bacterium]